MKNISRPAPAVAGLAFALFAAGSSAAAPELAVQSCNARSAGTRTPVVTHMIWYRNGSADDPLGKSGIAHFLEHLDRKSVV